MLRDELHDELGDILAGLRLAEAKVKDFLAGLRYVWEQEQATSFNTTEGLKTRCQPPPPANTLSRYLRLAA